MGSFVAFVFEGGTSSGCIETWVAKVREEMALSLAGRLRATGCFDEVIMVTDRSALAERALAQTGAVPDVRHDDGAFHFGARLSQALHRAAEHTRACCGNDDLSGFVYMSGGSGFFMGAEEIRSFARAVLANPHAVVANNTYSADMFGAADVNLVLKADLPASDNAAPMAVWAQGAELIALRQTIGTTFDVDTPSDLLVMEAVAERLGADAKGTVDEILRFNSAGIARERLDLARRVLERELAEAAIFGRVSPSTVEELNSLTRARLRIYSEERGMRSFGRDKPGGARSLIGRYIDSRGPEGFFADLAWCADVAFIDTRVLFSHMGAALSQEERFAADLFLPELVRDSRAARLVTAATDAEIPVVLGGHSLVSGGVRALALCPPGGDGIMPCWQTRK
ncbi:MAG: hypothetical protein VB144_12445 [Clostridia bacterium]|nr:hypothetical protein [Clostridia bacterium]